MKKVPFFSSVSVLLFLLLSFLLSAQVVAEDNSNMQNKGLTEVKKTVESDNYQDNGMDDTDSINNSKASEQSISSDTPEADVKTANTGVEKDKENSATFSREEANSIKHAKAISERNKKNLIDSGLIKNDGPEKLIVPEKSKPVVKKKVPVQKKINDSITEIKSTEQLTELLNGKVPVLVYFYADWSAPCDLLDKTMVEISSESDGKYQVVKVDADSSYGLCKQHDIKTLPTVILFVNGKEKERKVGSVIKYQYENMLASI